MSDLDIPMFAALNWFHLEGRGDVAVVTLDRDCRRSEMLNLFSRVLIDGNKYTVIGVESFAMEIQRKGWTIGLLIDGARIVGDDDCQNGGKHDWAVWKKYGPGGWTQIDCRKCKVQRRVENE